MSVPARSFPAADFDEASVRFRIALALCWLSTGGTAWLAFELWRQESAAAGVFGIALTLAVGAIPVLMPASMPSGYVVRAGEIVVVRKGLPAKVFGGVSTAERFLDASALRRRGFSGFGRSRFPIIVTSALGLPRGKVAIALTDRDKAVLVRVGSGYLFVSPADPEGFVEAVNSTNQA